MEFSFSMCLIHEWNLWKPSVDMVIFFEILQREYFSGNGV